MISCARVAKDVFFMFSYKPHVAYEPAGHLIRAVKRFFSFCTYKNAPYVVLSKQHLVKVFVAEQESLPCSFTHIC